MGVFFPSLPTKFVNIQKDIYADEKRETAMICKKYKFPRIMSIEIQRVTAHLPQHAGFDEARPHIPASNQSIVN